MHTTAIQSPQDVFSATDRAFMRQALALAARGLTTTTPNPRVGCVIVKNGQVIGEGFHARAGEPHAEANAFADARARNHDPRGSTLYVTLEPCDHQGRTLACSEAIIAAGVACVIAAIADPDPVAAGGAARLRAAGVRVALGLLEGEARELNIGFISRVTRGVPWVRSKIAASLDGRTALVDGTSQWITGPEARADGHAWRARACAILTGVGTVLHDNPRLTVRAVPTTRQPLRVVIDRHADTPPDARVLADGSALMITAGKRNDAWPAGTQCVAMPDDADRVDLGKLMRELGQRGINELHVEAGARLNGALLAAGLIDEVLLYVAPALLGDPARGMFTLPAPLSELAARVQLAWQAIDRVGDDLRIVARVLKQG